MHVPGSPSRAPQADVPGHAEGKGDVLQGVLQPPQYPRQCEQKPAGYRGCLEGLRGSTGRTGMFLSPFWCKTERVALFTCQPALAPLQQALCTRAVRGRGRVEGKKGREHGAVVLGESREHQGKTRSDSVIRKKVLLQLWCPALSDPWFQVPLCAPIPSPSPAQVIPAGCGTVSLWQSQPAELRTSL